MEPRDDKGDDTQQASDSPRTGSAATDQPPQSGRPNAMSTNDPVIGGTPERRSEWVSDPDRTAVIETSRIRGPSETSNPTYIPVPVEPYSPNQDDSGVASGGGERARQNGRDKGRDHVTAKDEQDQKHSGDHDHDQGHAKKGPSLTRMLLYCGAVALVCGILGAWGFSHFAGSKKSDDKQSSDKGSKSDKNSDSGPESDSDKTGEASGKSQEAGKLVQAETAWMTAVKELRQSRAAEKSARRSEEESKAVIDFLKNTLLSAGRPGDVSLTEAFWAGGQGKDMTLRKALDMSESRVAQAFGERPVAEASIREMLGLGYLNVGDAAQAVKQYERALALREAMQGAGDSDTAACRNQLAVAYRLAGRADEGNRLFERSQSSPAHAAALAVRGSMLLAQKQPADAELKLRECLRIREKTLPDDWRMFDTKSMLGEALLDQNELTDAEPLMLSGYEGLKKHQHQIPPDDQSRLIKAVDRLVRLYEAWGKDDKAMRWRQERETIEAIQGP